MSRYLTHAQLPLAREVLRNLFRAGEESGDAVLTDAELFSRLAKSHRAKKVKQKNNLRTNLNCVLNILEDCGILNRTKSIDATYGLGIVRRVRQVSICITNKTKRELRKNTASALDNVCAATTIDQVLIACGAMYSKPVLAATGPPEDASLSGAPITTSEPVTKKSTKNTGHAQFVRRVRPANVVSSYTKTQPAPDNAAEKTAIDQPHSNDSGVEKILVNLDDVSGAIALLKDAAQKNMALYAGDGDYYLFKSHRDGVREMHARGGRLMPMAIRPLLLSLLDAEQPVPEARGKRFPASVLAIAPLLGTAPYMIMTLIDAFKTMLANKEEKGGFSDHNEETRLFMTSMLELQHILRDVKFLASQALAAGEPMPLEKMTDYALRLDKEISAFKQGAELPPTLSFLFPQEEALPRVVMRNKEIRRIINHKFPEKENANA